ncbi:hypothetical protein USB125703_01470 [Pseudoclavibacter triregionum]|nr:hypothetical protein USB125703_01470 [Pseudoclavibacter triregionum]
MTAHALPAHTQPAAAQPAAERTRPSRAIRFARRLAAALVALLVMPLALAGCTLFAKDKLVVLAGSEVKDMAPILEEMARDIGVELEFEYMGTLDGTEALLNAGDQPKWDATWFPSNRYLSLFPEGQSLISKSESIMRSDVVLGLKPEVTQRLGWQGKQVTWQQIVDAIGAGQLTYGMTSPISSNSGFTTLVQLSTALSGTGTVLVSDDVAKVTPQLTQFAKGQTLASGSSGWLAERFAEAPEQADGIFNYDSVLATLSVNGQQLDVIRPSDGTISSDYPLSLLSSAGPDATGRFDKVVEYLLRDEVQQKIAETTHRQTSSSSAPTGAAPYPVFQLPFPNTLGTVQTLLTTWIANVKKASNMVFAIDTSGSMGADGRMEQLGQALAVLSGEQQDGTASLLRLQPRETITYLEFGSNIKSDVTVEIPSDAAGYQAALDKIEQTTSGYRPGGSTAIFDTVQTAYERAIAQASGDRLSSIVLFTDGQNTTGSSERQFESWYQGFVAQHPEAKDIPVYAIVFGEGDVGELEQLAALTGGRTFDAGSTSLASVFREIRGYL